MSEAPSTAPVCYRHPSRETYIRCTRCERPICPDCMNEAAVGHQCPECVAEGRRSQRPARTAFGGSRAGQAGLATRALIGINVIVFVISAISGGARALGGSGGWFGMLGASTPVTQWGEVLGYAPYRPGGPVHGIAAGEWYRLGTAMFLHYGVLHILLNMWVLWQLGRYLEARLGPARFVALYLLAGLGGNVAAYVFTAPNQPAAATYDAVYLLRDVIARSGPRREAVRRALAGVGSVTPAYEGVTGAVAFDAVGDVPNQNVYIGLVHRGRIEVENQATAVAEAP